jgi:hypothetical protein
MGIQPSDYEPMMNAPCPCGPGGNMALINQDDDNTPAAIYENVAIVREGYQEDYSTVDPAFREAEL